jgi:hypothetical protein
MNWRDYWHRDGLTLHNALVEPIEPSRKVDGRGMTTGGSIMLGEAERDPYLSGENDWYAVIAFPSDVHHAVMTPEQALCIAKILTGVAERVQARRDETIVRKDQAA